MTSANTNLTRANRLTVKVLTNGIMQADFYRTHKHITSVYSDRTAYQPKADANKSAIREDFRSYVADHASEYGVDYDPTDRRTDANLRKASYMTEGEVAEDLVAMITPDVEKFMAKMPHSDIITLKSITADSFTPKTHTSKGTDLSTMGIENGKYINSGKLAWYDIEVTVTMMVRDTAEIYEIINMELVSGQLKKSRMTQTQWNLDAKQSLADIGIVDEDPKAKAEKSAKAEDAQPTEDKPKAKKSTRSKKSINEAKAE